jgi:CDP-6-deoxy-D-xylo-4-hexulose-3-dehydrase
MTDWQAAIGSAQIDKLPSFCEQRKANFRKHKAILSKYSEFFILPEATENSDPSWFSFIVTLKDGIPFTRDELTGFLNKNLIETRNLFAGNISKQPAFMNKNFRIADNLNRTEKVMRDTFFLGTYPGLTDEMFAYIESIFDEFLKKKQEIKFITTFAPQF